ncbi:MAG TPA: HEAT repeat domain-containing protein [Phycisphaerae bacterium]|nr:HEAT repeat domain-containing protein [Phycisphaerae bacterium]HRW55212.1 HEAT repeat domain-containing protein [Phycisphaerae bacterium]
MPRFSIPHAVFVCLLAATGVVSADDVRMSFRNNTTPGHLTIHRVRRQTKRIAPRRDYEETIEYVQSGEWVQVNLDEPKPGEAAVYQMFNDDPPEILSLYRGAERIRSLPNPIDFNIKAGATYLNSERRTRTDSPFKPPSGDTAQEVVMALMLDVAHWDRKTIDSGHRWERDIQTGYFKGVQRFEFAGVEQTDAGKVGAVRMIVEGDFAGPLARSHKFIRSRAVIYWANLERTFASVETRVEYARRRPTGDEKYQLRIDLGLKRAESLTEAQSELLRQQLNVFAGALTRSSRKDYAGVSEACRQFRSTWPGSIWTPAFDELQMRSIAGGAPDRMKTSEVLDAIRQCVVLWETATKNQEYDELDRTRETLIRLNEASRSKILKLTRDDSSKTRAAAAFALAFSPEPSDLQNVHKATRDASPRVRGMALAGLAARGDPGTNTEILLLRLSDGHPMVRARACRAVAACVAREHYAIAQVAKQLNEMLVSDESETVRREAIRAIAAVGAPADIAHLQSAKEKETSARNRAEIDRAIERLRELGA